MIFVHDFYYLDFYFQDNYLPVDFTGPLKLSILSNHAEYSKRLVPFILRIISFYSFYLCN